MSDITIRQDLNLEFAMQYVHMADPRLPFNPNYYQQQLRRKGIPYLEQIAEGETAKLAQQGLLPLQELAANASRSKDFGYSTQSTA